MPTDRTVVLGGVWADAAPDPPPAPVAEVTYADSGLTPEEIATGWPFRKIVDSAKFNELMRRATTFLSLLESWGMLPWCALTTYGIGAWALGSDGHLYQSLQAVNLNHNPTSSPAWWADSPANLGAATAETPDTLVLRDGDGLAHAETPSLAAPEASALVPAGWVQGWIARGRVSAAGTAVSLPAGWTCERTSTGRYRITHGLGATALLFLGIPENTGASNLCYTVNPVAYASDYVDVVVNRADPEGHVNVPFGFVVFRL